LTVAAQPGHQIVQLGAQLIESTQVGHLALPGLTVLAIGLDNLEITISAFALPDGGDAWKHGGGLANEWGYLAIT
jgi:hypothetical protein